LSSHLKNLCIRADFIYAQGSLIPISPSLNCLAHNIEGIDLVGGLCRHCRKDKEESRSAYPQQEERGTSQ